LVVVHLSLTICEHAMHAEGAWRHKIYQRQGGVPELWGLQEDGIYPTCEMIIIQRML
jgi:hypothetical protein